MAKDYEYLRPLDERAANSQTWRRHTRVRSEYQSDEEPLPLYEDPPAYSSS
jgi:hypothetical protein